MKLSKKEIQIEKYLKENLPNTIFKKMTSGDSDEKIPNYIQYQIYRNTDLIGSKYFYSAKREFIHFTKLESVKSIISSCLFRLYNMYNMNDPREYTFANNDFHKLIHDREDPKENLFLMSMCKPKILSGDSGLEFNMWRLYSNDGEGIALKIGFEKTNNYNWEDFYLSEVYYGSEERNILYEAYQYVNYNEIKHPSASIDFSQISGFHKPKFYHFENEVRLLADYRKFKVNGSMTFSNNEGERLFPIIKENSEKSTSHLIKFLELPIYSKISFQDEYEVSTIPIPTIKEIIIGHKNKDNFKELSQELQNLCLKHLGYIPIIKMSRISKWFF